MAVVLKDLSRAALKELSAKGGCVLRVTMTQDFIFQGNHCNGWTAQQIIDQWFVRDNFNLSHAARDASCVGNSKQIIQVEVLAENGVPSQPKTRIISDPFKKG